MPDEYDDHDEGPHTAAEYYGIFGSGVGDDIVVPQREKPRVMSQNEDLRRRLNSLPCEQSEQPHALWDALSRVLESPLTGPERDFVARLLKVAHEDLDNRVEVPTEASEHDQPSCLECGDGFNFPSHLCQSCRRAANEAAANDQPPPDPAWDSLRRMLETNDEPPKNPVDDDPIPF